LACCCPAQEKRLGACRKIQGRVINQPIRYLAQGRDAVLLEGRLSLWVLSFDGGLEEAAQKDDRECLLLAQLERRLFLIGKRGAVLSLDGERRWWGKMTVGGCSLCN
jgi:cytidylate kinase